jgi:DNA-binding NarL/FixJ family response regulator
MPNAPIKVSLVEDDAQARGIVASWLQESDGFVCVSEYGSAEEAVDGLPSANPDIVLMDINLPGISGVECVRRLKTLMPSCQFIMVTVYEDSDNLFNALRAGASGYLLKTTPLDELLTALQSVHSGGAPMTGSVARKLIQHFQPQARSTNFLSLSPRETQILDLLAQGCLYKEIAHLLKISIPTVNTHIRNIYEKLHVHSRAQAVAKYNRSAHSP